MSGPTIDAGQYVVTYSTKVLSTIRQHKDVLVCVASVASMEVIYHDEVRLVIVIPTTVVRIHRDRP